jgi:hypothetical protein
MRAIAIFIAFLGLTMSAGAVEKAKAKVGEQVHYKWKDAQGSLHYDDTLPEAALQFGYDMVNHNGMLIRHVDRARTAEEQKADKETAAKAAAEKHVAEQQAQHDQQILAAYPNEKDLMHNQQAQLDSLDQEVRATQLSLDSQEKSLASMLSRAAELERTGKTVPPALQKQIEAQRSVVAKQKDFITAKHKERADTVQRFANELAHYSELRAAQSKK